MGMTRRGFLGAVLAAGGAASCGSSFRVQPVTTPVPVAFDACPRSDRPSFSVLTWNVFLMPRWIHESPRNGQRAAAIAATLLEQDYDILCLQKVFDGESREILEGFLGAKYPYRYGPANDSCSLKLNSGVWVLSRHPLTDYQAIEFDDCAGVECLSRKGAMLLSGSCSGATFRLIATHLQGEEGSSFTEKGQRTRNAQMDQIRDQLFLPHLEKSIPFLFCGDFGTPRFTGYGRTETPEYRRMLTTFRAENGAEPRITLADSPRYNQLASSDTGRCNELDYVLVSANGCPVAVERTRHVFRRAGWDEPPGARLDLSYRYAVSARVTFGPVVQAR